MQTCMQPVAWAEGGCLLQGQLRVKVADKGNVIKMGGQCIMQTQLPEVGIPLPSSLTSAAPVSSFGCQTLAEARPRC